jgi:hypothetical protein
MNFQTPLAFSLAALLPIVVALYLLKLRREERHVSSTYLWRTLVRDTAANAPWQKLTPNLLLLLQLLFLLALILALARPFYWTEAATGAHLILVIDTSASMGATDVAPHRLGAAIQAAQQWINNLPAGGRVTLIEAGSQTRVPVSGASGPEALAALQALRPGPAGADFDSALTLAAAMAAREPDSDIVILSDGQVAAPAHLTVPGRVHFIPLGNSPRNQAIGALTLQAESGGASWTAFVQMINWDTQAAQRRLVLYADGQLFAARDVTLFPHQPYAVSVPGFAPDVRVVEARWEGADDLAVDDAAWAVPPTAAQVAVNLVTDGNRFLEVALDLLPNVELTVNAPLTRSIPAPAVQLTVFDATLPDGAWPEGHLLFIAPFRSTEFFSVTGAVLRPTLVPVAANDPLLQYAEADWRELVVQSAVRISLPAWGRAVLLDATSSAPMLIVGEAAGRRIGVLAFDLRQSDLPLRVAFPVLLANLAAALTPGGGWGIPPSVQAGQPVIIPAPPQAAAVTVRAPDGRAYQLTPADGRVVFEHTDRAGVYTVQAEATTELARFTVNLFSATESNIAPRDTLPISGAGSAAPPTRLRGRNEWWPPIAWLALALLVAEWLLAHRGQLAQILNWKGR